ncbi:MAG: secondary thiamine-phosphate synthase enzyme YjbQ [Anaerosomatales bacterium]|nr:secondary thiamine-phosphate synthase enzyme YjbQ [Anaerosomatales bacterium]
MTRFEIHTTSREAMVDVTEKVRQALQASGALEGWVLVYCPHTTAGVTINENADPAVPDDVLRGLGDLVPRHGAWSHAEGNSDAHIKASLIGSSVTIPVADGDLMLGTWQGVFLCEFDGPRRRYVSVSVLPV